MLVRMKVLHTVVWAFVAGCIVALPVVGAYRNFFWAAILSSVVLLECVVLVANRGRCPLTDVASRYTDDRRENFDIYLPLWLARHNKAIFGMLFLVGEAFVLWRWWLSRT